MKNIYKLAVLGGDLRLVHAAKRLAETGFSVSVYALAERICKEDVREESALSDALADADAVLLPVPLTRDGVHLFSLWKPAEILISEIFENAPRHAAILAGGADGFSEPRLYDYAKREDFARKNAIPTAEGALLLALEALSETIHGLSVGIIGFGRVARECAALFHRLDAKITVFARRKEARNEASREGFAAFPVSSLFEYAQSFRLLINTVPARVIDEKTLSALSEDALLLELASKPYGADPERATEMGVHMLLGGALPGKYFPKTAGIIIADTVTDMLREIFDLT